METAILSPATADIAANGSTLDGKLFDFETAKVQPLTLDQLARTYKENDVYGNPIKGVYHYELLNNILCKCREHGYKPEVYDLFAAQNRDRNTPGVSLLPQVEARYGQRAVEAHILRRIFANIRLTDFDEGGNTTNLAVAFHQRGIQVGFGNMVEICHNQCMLHPGQYAATYNEKGHRAAFIGKKQLAAGGGLSIPELMTTVDGWLTDARGIVDRERAKMERMKNCPVSADTMLKVIGQLTAIRVKCDTQIASLRESSTTYPLNQAQITRFTEKMLLRYAEKGRLSVWDLYDAATDLYKADGSMDMPEILPQNRAMVNFLDEQFVLNR